MNLGNHVSLSVQRSLERQQNNVSPLELLREGGLMFHCRNWQAKFNSQSQSLPFKLPIHSAI